jgi:hypothetical protein
LFLALETADKAEVKMHFPIHMKAWRTWSYYSSTEYCYYIQCWMEVSGEFDGPAEKELPLLLDRLLGEPQTPSGKYW